MMDWSEITSHKTPRKKRDIFIMTASQSLEQIEFLAMNLTNSIIHIAATTLMGDYLNSLRKYENIRLYPSILEWNCKKLIELCDVYLDINHEVKNQEVIEKIVEKKKPILSFNNVVNPYHVDQVFSNDNPQEMCDYIKKI